MGYQFYNNNRLGFFKNDCTVRSIACATGKSWDNVYEKLSSVAQLQGTMMDDRDFIINYLDNKYERVPTFDMTVGEVAQEYCDKIILITMPSHITCAKYGVIYDSFDPRNRQSEFCWVVQ